MKKTLETRLGIVIPWLALTALAACSAAGFPAPDRESERRSMKITAIDFEWDAVPEHGIGLNMINERFQVDYRPTFYLADRYYDKLVSVLTSNRIPDIISFPNDSLKFIQFAKQGLFLPLNEYIDTYSTFQAVPPAMYERFSVNGNIYGIPQYYPSYNMTPIIRKDWLDNLGLSMPTNFEELKQVAIAFAHDDPDGNGKDDTYGIVTGRNYYPDYGFGAYWDSAAWLHKNEAGDYIPGSISEGFKQQIAIMAELYAEGALAKIFRS
ncbi:extracellular solute-binding protein [Paenibacillus residui]|uniref:Extracellular solute-binding protein n=1 Tax=Paenibacillus residui TaxID=629724 RepID=A0ABW3D4G0_9BACL